MPPPAPIKPRLTFPEVMNIVRAGRTTIYAWVKQGRFPKPIKIGARLLWSAEAVERFLASREEVASGS